MLNFDFEAISQALPLLIQGVKITIFISVISSVLAFGIGLVVVFFRLFGQSFVKNICTAYVEIVRNTPLLIQLYIYYKALPDLGIQLPPIACGIIALSIYTGAFISEVLRAGINSIAPQQYEGARGLGLSRIQAFSLVVFPQAIRIMIPALSNQFINLIKNSSLVSFISVTDVFYVVYKQAVDDFRFFEFFLVGALIYMSMTGLVAVLSNIIERKFSLQGGNVKV